jgi:ATP:ADP antiporter, AAA family
VLLGFIGLAIVGSLAMVVILEATSKAVQRAIMRPARETLFTVLSRTDKYKAKAFIDTFVYRGGDVIGAQVEGLLKSLGMGLVALSSLVIPMSIGWMFLGIWLGRRQIAKAAEQGHVRSAPDLVERLKAEC